MRVGNQWWTELGLATRRQEPVPGNPYGDGTEFNYCELAESWAEFLGTNHALRLYPGASGVKQATNTVGTAIIAGQYYRMDNLIENEFWFFGGRWIPYGLYHDLRDPANLGETWDNVNGITIQQMFDAFGPNVINMCDYRDRFLLQNPTLNAADVNDIFDEHRAICR